MSHWFQLLHCGEVYSKALAGKGVYSISVGHGTYQARAQPRLGADWRQSFLTAGEVLPQQKPGVKFTGCLCSTHRSEYSGVSAMYLVLISCYYCSALLWFLFWPSGTTVKLANSDEITLHTGTITTCDIYPGASDALCRCLESMNPTRSFCSTNCQDT